MIQRSLHGLKLMGQGITLLSALPAAKVLPSLALARIRAHLKAHPSHVIHPAMLSALLLLHLTEHLLLLVSKRRHVLRVARPAGNLFTAALAGSHVSTALLLLLRSHHLLAMLLLLLVYLLADGGLRWLTQALQCLLRDVLQSSVLLYQWLHALHDCGLLRSLLLMLLLNLLRVRYALMLLLLMLLLLWMAVAHLRCLHGTMHSARGARVLHLALLLLLLLHHLVTLLLLLNQHHLMSLLHGCHLLWVPLRSLHHGVALHLLLHVLTLHVGYVLNLIRHHVAVVLGHLLLFKHLHLVLRELILVRNSWCMHWTRRRCALVHAASRAIWSHARRLGHLAIRHRLTHIGCALMDLRSTTLAAALLLAHLSRHRLLHGRSRSRRTTWSLTRSLGHRKATLWHHWRRIHHWCLLPDHRA